MDIGEFPWMPYNGETSKKKKFPQAANDQQLAGPTVTDSKLYRDKSLKQIMTAVKGRIPLRGEPESASD